MIETTLPAERAILETSDLAAIRSNPIQLQSHTVDVDLYRLRARVHRIWLLATRIAKICIVITFITTIIEMHKGGNALFDYLFRFSDLCER